MAKRRTVILHGYPIEEIDAFVAAVREVSQGEVVFAVTTPTSLEWQLQYVIDHVNGEHEDMKQVNPPM